jgi:hypothetical protein
VAASVALLVVERAREAFIKRTTAPATFLFFAGPSHAGRRSTYNDMIDYDIVRR